MPTAASPRTRAATPTASDTSATPSASPTGTEERSACVSQALDGLDPEQRLGQLLMVGFDTNAPLDALDELVRESHVGNVIYLGGWEGADKVTRTSEHLQGLVTEDSTGSVGLLVAADQEGGIVTRLGPATGFPAVASEAEIGRGSTAAARAWARTIATTLDDAGVDLNFAPVVDLDVNPRSPAIGALDRSKGAALLEAMDACTRRWGRGAVVPANAGLVERRTWSTKFEMRSPRYTTRVDELPVVAAA